MAASFRIYLLILSSVAIFCSINGENVIPSTSYCYDDNGWPTRCEPPRNSFSLDVIPQVNSTCGSPPTGFCFRQVDPLRQVFSSDCTGICNASDSQLSHPPELMTDFLLNEQSWWQSENSVKPQQVVTIDVPLGTSVELSVIAFNFISPLPSNFYILKSNDFGETYIPFHYFSASCLDTYGIDPDQNLNLENETSILCQEIPYLPTQGLISFFPALGRPSTNDSTPGFSEELYNFITATDITIVLVENYPITNRDVEDFGYYYALEDLSIIGSCQCHGHASSCVRDTSLGTYRCECQHNTTGHFCERCADLYQDIPWQRADGNSHFECQACNCNNHSSLCVFNQTVYEQNDRTSGGVCVECLHNTAGRQCGTCATYFYHQQGVPFSDPTACISCDCHIAGVTNDGDCAKDNSTSGIQVGNCFCKENVFGRTCSQCVPGYFNLSLANDQGCQACECNATGSASSECNSLTGECDCKPNIQGSKCDICIEGFYLSNPSSLDGCQSCDCNLGGSLSPFCDMYTGQCPCRSGLTGQTCSDVIPGYFFPSIDYLIFEAENAKGAHVVTNGGFAYHLVTGPEESITFGPLTPPTSGFYDVVIRYDLEGILMSTASLVISSGSEEGDGPTACDSVPVINGSLQVSYPYWNMGVGLSNSQRVCLQGGQSYNFELNYFDLGQTNSTAVLRIDSLVLIFVNSSTLVQLLGAQILIDYGHCASFFRSLSTFDSAEPSCEQTIFLVSTALYSGALRCNCSTTGTLSGQDCDTFGGQCPCLPNVIGLQCNECFPGYHSLSTSGCRACTCDLDGSLTEICGSDGGTCECLTNVVGQNCSECAKNYWDLSPGEGCRECGCNITGAVSLQCDMQSGLCSCKPGIEGANCDICQDQHYGFSLSGCRTCMCSLSGSLNLLCSNMSGQCECKRNVQGRDCSQCIEQTYNLEQTNPHGCQPCFCSGKSNNCTSASGYAAAVISSQFNDSADHGWTATNEEIDLSNRSSAGILLEPNTASYLRAPPIFLKNKLSSYNQYIMLAIESFNMTIKPTILPADIVLSSESMRIGANFSIPSFYAGLTIFQIHLHETTEWTDMSTDLPVDAYGLQLILSSLNNLYITASYDGPVAVNTITMDTTELTSTIEDEVSWVEQCSCPINYEGLSCEQCADGYTRSVSGSCEPCQCNGFSENCDPETGVCTDCNNFTTGGSCEFCQIGTYGNPLQQIPCQLCPCPLTSEPGQFSTNCSFSETLNDVICFDCPHGHTGFQCESCISGYFGDPTGHITGVSTMCSDCQCNGNIDFDNPEACDNTSGICLQCVNNTSGDQCEVCSDGYYGDAINVKNCSVCDCDLSGSNTSTCDPITGQCFCYPNVVGRRCSECADSHYGYGSSSGCSPCTCHSEGAENNQCDMNGQCQCKPGVTGLNCDQCIEGYYRLSSRGCTECSCSPNNSLSVSCDETGICTCKSGATTPNCSQCIQNYFQTEIGCSLCPDCYRELEQTFVPIQIMFSNSLSQLQQILSLAGNDTIPFSEQLDDFQRISMLILTLVNNTLTRYHFVLMQYYNHIEIINQTLLNEVSQLEIDLSTLRRLSTTVLVLASTSEELMNRTISDFIYVQQVVQEIQTTLLLNITQIVSYLEEQYNIVSTIEQEISARRQLLSSQIAELQFLINVTQLHSNSAVNTFFSVQDATIVIENQHNNLEIISVTLSSAIQSLGSEMTMLKMQITMLIDLIQQQLNSLPNYLSLQNKLNLLITNASLTENHAVFDVRPEIYNHINEYSRINSTIGLNIENFNNLKSNLTTTVNNTRTALFDLIALETVTKQTVSSVLVTINLAQQVFSKLRNFSINSQSIANITNQATEHSQTIRNEVLELQSHVDNITRDIQVAKSNAQSARQIALNSENISTKTKEVASAIDLSFPLQLVGRNEDSIEELVTNASRVSVLQNNLVNYSSRIDEADMSTGNATTLSLSVKELNSTASDHVMDLQVNLDLPYILSQNVTALQLLIEDLYETLSEHNIAVLYQELQNKLANQVTTRQTLETYLQSLQEQVYYLEYANTLLPKDCM